LTGLAENTAYHYRVISVDAAGNQAAGADRAFATKQSPDTTAPTVNIEAPTAEPAYAYENANNQLTIAGTANDDRGVVAVTYQAGSQTGTANGTANWTFDVALQEGANAITVTVTDAAGNTGTDTIIVTYAKPDTAAPAISQENADADINQAVITWTTDEPATTLVEYGLTEAYGQTAMDANMTINHAITLNGLAENTAYHYRITATDAAGNLATGADRTFTTKMSPDTAVPTAIIMAPTSNANYAYENANNQLTFSGTANDDRGVVAVTYQAGSQTGTANGTANWTFDVSLQEGANTIIVTAADAAGNTGTDTIEVAYTKIITPPVDEPPAMPSGFKAVPDNGRVILAWTNPSDADFAEAAVYRSNQSISESSLAQATVIYRGTNRYTIDSGLTNGTRYYYAIIAEDQAGNRSQPAFADAVPASDKKTTSAAKNFLRTLTGATIKVRNAELKSFAAKTWSEAGALMAESLQFVPLSEQEAGEYDKIMASNTKRMSAKQRYALARFLSQGTDSTKRFSLEERAALIAEFQTIYGRLPMYRTDWGSLMKLANGRWPNAKAAGEGAEALFYNSATIGEEVEYEGKMIERSPEHEEYSKKLYEDIFGRKPKSNLDWSFVRALAYDRMA
jgi:hypothetical protein